MWLKQIIGNEMDKKEKKLCFLYYKNNFVHENLAYFSTSPVADISHSLFFILVLLLFHNPYLSPIWFGTPISLT